MNSRRRQYPIVLVEKVVAYARRPEVTTRQLKEYASTLFGGPVPQSTIANWLSRNGVRLLDANRTPVVETSSSEARLFMRSPAAIRERHDTNGQERKILLAVYNMFYHGEPISTEKILNIVHQQYPSLSNRQLENIFQKYMLTCKITDYERNQIRYEQLVQEVSVHFPELRNPRNHLGPAPISSPGSKQTPVTRTSFDQSRDLQDHHPNARQINQPIHQTFRHSQLSTSQSYQPPSSSSSSNHYNVPQVPVQMPPITPNSQFSPSASPTNNNAPSSPNTQFTYSSSGLPIPNVSYQPSAYPIPNQQQYPSLNSMPSPAQAQSYQYPVYYSPYVDPNHSSPGMDIMRATNQNVWIPPQA